MISRWVRLSVLLFCAAALADCDGVKGVVADAEVYNSLASAASPQPVSYRLSAGDKVTIQVFNEPDFSGDFQLTESGKLVYPLVGEIDAAGTTADELQKRLSQRLSKGFVRNPRVAVTISYRPVNVLGEVKNAGQYPFRPGLTLQDAIALAGGYSYRANTGTVYIRHVNAGSELSARTDGEAVSIEPGDTIRVPERFF